MKTTQQILKTAYESTPKLKEQLDTHGLTLDDVGIHFIQSNEYHKQDTPVILNYSMQDEEVAGIAILLRTPKTSFNSGKESFLGS